MNVSQSQSEVDILDMEEEYIFINIDIVNFDFYDFLEYKITLKDNFKSKHRILSIIINFFEFFMFIFFP
jgi:hypothetical protein